MKIGINMLLWTTDATTPEFVPIFEELKALGYDGVEIPIFSDDVDGFAALGKTLDSIGLKRTGLTVLSEANCPMSDDPAIRIAGVDALKRAIDCCVALGGPLLCGPLHSALGCFSGKAPVIDQLSRSAQSLHAASLHAEQAGVTLAVEYLNRFEAYLLNSAVDTVAFLEQVGHPSCKMMYDTFHAHIEEKHVGEAIRIGGSNIVHLHVSESDRSTLGTGQIHWDETFAALGEIGYDGWWMIEAFGLAMPELAAATKIWRRMYSTELDLARDSIAFLKQHVS